ncbi:MAG: UPF0280 family protein [Pseudomonadota bacterium]
MTARASSGWLDGGRLHLHHGPIDLVVTAEGSEQAEALDAARARFDTVLDVLVSELDHLRVAYNGHRFQGPVAVRMAAAVGPLARDRFVTPMAAVAGAVADEILAAMQSKSLIKAVVNNGGDIAFYLTDGEQFTATAPTGELCIQANTPFRGVATSGWRGRSQSLGIADAVTVVAKTAARADAAATLIANAVDLPGHPAISRVSAEAVEAIPQLGARLVTAEVGTLNDADRRRALKTGQTYAETLVASGTIGGAALMLQGETRIIGWKGIATTPVDGLS